MKQEQEILYNLVARILEVVNPLLIIIATC